MKPLKPAPMARLWANPFVEGLLQGDVSSMIEAVKFHEWARFESNKRASPFFARVTPRKRAVSTFFCFTPTVSRYTYHLYSKPIQRKSG